MKLIHSSYLLIIFFIIFSIISCKDEELEKKIDPNLKIRLAALKESSKLDQNISVVFKSSETLTEKHKSALSKKGIKIQANIGPIYTAVLPAKSIYYLTKMRFVETVQGSQELKSHQNEMQEKTIPLKENN